MMRLNFFDCTRPLRLGVMIAALGIAIAVPLAVPNGARASHVTVRPSAARTIAPTKRLKLAIQGMDCKGCESGIAGELKQTPGVVAAEVSYEWQEAIVDYDPAQITPAGIIARIRGAGFGARVKRG